MKTWKPDSTDLKALKSDANILFLSGPVGPLPGYAQCWTPSGWVRLDTVKEGDTALVYDRYTGKTKFESVGVVVTPASLGFVRMRNDQGTLDITSSPSHRWLVEGRSGARKVKTTKELCNARPGAYSFIRGFEADERVKWNLEHIDTVESDDGKQYCLTTSTGFFVVRFSPGHVYVTGNTGKSSLTLMKIVQFTATKMLPINGVRRARVIVAREDAPKLETSTQTVLTEWYGKAVEFHGNYPKTANLRIINSDQTVSDIEFILKGFPDSPKEIYDNFSGVPANILWVNEVQTYSTPDIIEMGFQRMGRFLSKAEGNQGYGLVIADFNPPSAAHWLAEWKQRPPDIVAQEAQIEGFDYTDAVQQFKVEFIQWPSPFIANYSDAGVLTGYKINPEFDSAFKQPAGIAYWAKIMAANAKDPNKIRTNIFGEFGYRSDGIPVYNGVYNERIHVSSTKLQLDSNRMLYIGCDPSGFRGAAVMMQEGTRGLEVFAEVAEPDEQLSFYELLHDYIVPWIRRNNFPDKNVQFVLDPANHANDAKMTPRDECRAAGFHAVNAPTNDPDARIEALRYFLLRTRILIDNTDETRYVRQGLQADYYWKKQGSGLSAPKPRPEKTRPYSDCVEAIQYTCLWFRRGAATEESIEAGFTSREAGYVETDASEIF